MADERSGPLSGLAPNTADAARKDARTQSATFQIGGLGLELSASPGAARLVVGDHRTRDTYVVDPVALSAWGTATAKLLTLAPARSAQDRIEIRTPFLVDREGRRSIAFEGLVYEHGVTYRLLVSGARDKIAGIMTTEDVVRGVSDAARGAGALGRPST